MTQTPAARFLALRDDLASRHPASIAEAVTLAGSVVNPASADAEQVWRVLWDKPLYANTRVSVANTWVKSLEPAMIGAWKVWGATPEVFQIQQIAPGTQRENFRVEGSVAHAVVAQSKIALHRLFRIQGAATALRARAKVAAQPFKDLQGKPVSQIVPMLQAEFGPGWGPITVLHALADMGLAVKPDLHLVKTMRALGLMPGFSSGKVPALRETMQINEAVVNLMRDIEQDPTPQGLRYIDKVLMEISRSGLLESLAVPG